MSARILPEDPAALGPAAEPESVARTILLDQLTGRARSRVELAQALAKKGVPAEIGDRLLERFERVGLIDDAAFARSWVESRQAGKGLARRALAQELVRKGVSPEDAATALEAVDGEAEEAAARGLVEAKLRRLSGVSRETAVRRLTGMLARKGYSPGLAYRVVREQLEAAGMEAESLAEQ